MTHLLQVCDHHWRPEAHKQHGKEREDLGQDEAEDEVVRGHVIVLHALGDGDLKRGEE